MSVEWDRTKQRQRVLRAALEDVGAGGDATVLHRHPIAATFGDLDAFLLAVQARWATAVFARVDRVLETGPGAPEAALAEQLQELDAALPGTRVLLDAHAARPSVAAARARLRRRILADLGVDLDRLPAPVRRERRPARLRGHLLFRRPRLSPAG